MPKIQPGTPAAVRTARQEPAAAPKKTVAQAPQQKAGWAAKTAGTGAASAKVKYPEVATTAKAVVDANAKASKAMSQMDMVAGSVEINKATDGVLKRTMQELSSQLADRGQDQKADAVLKDMDAFFKQVGGAKGYYVDPDRGSMAALEDNGDRMQKVSAKLAEVAAELGKVNAEPSADNQQAYNRSAGGDAVKQEALFTLAFQKAADGGNADKAISAAQTFFKALPKNVDSQIESRGGSMEPLERAGGTATALEEMSKKLAALN
jgi:hypothetical protein